MEQQNLYKQNTNLAFYALHLLVHHLRDNFLVYPTRKEIVHSRRFLFDYLHSAQFAGSVQRTFQYYANGKVNEENSNILLSIVLCYMWDVITQHLSTKACKTLLFTDFVVF